MWLGKFNLSKALTLAKKQLESLFVSSLIPITGDTRDNPDRHKGGNNSSTYSFLLSYKNSLYAQCQQANAINSRFLRFRPKPTTLSNQDRNCVYRNFKECVFKNRAYLLIFLDELSKSG
ncbi:hypothetical protein YC2023_019300 [Brassica napus]